MLHTRRNAQYKKFLVILYAFIFASILYILFYLKTRDSRVLSIPLETIESQEFVNNSNIPDKVEIKILGSRDLIYSLDVSSIKAVLDFSFINKKGIYNVPINLEYDLGIIDKRRIEISSTKKDVRISFVER